MGTIRVVVVDDHAMVAESLTRLLESEGDFRVVALAVNVAGAMEAVRTCRPDVVVMDYRLPDGDGVSATTRIRQNWPTTRVVLLTGAGDADVVKAALAAGCSGYVEKTDAASSLVTIVRAALADEATPAPAQLRRRFVHGGTVAEALLTRREREVLRVMAGGASDKAIAAELTVAVSTVRAHVRSILTKLGARSKVEAVALGRRRGLLPD